MKLEITKLWADSLRTYSQNNLGIPLKSAHAHELVAAYFGYSSRAALLADTKCPVSNLDEAEFIVLTPGAFIKERCQDLHGLPESLSHELGGHSSPNYTGMTLQKTWPTFDFLALTLANESLHATHLLFKTKKFSVKVEPYGDGVYLKVFCEYSLLHSGERGTRGVVNVFDLKRVAGHIGYVKSKHYSFEATSLDSAIGQMTSNETIIK